MVRQWPKWISVSQALVRKCIYSPGHMSQKHSCVGKAWKTTSLPYLTVNRVRHGRLKYICTHLSTFNSTCSSWEHGAKWGLEGEGRWATEADDKPSPVEPPTRPASQNQKKITYWIFFFFFFFFFLYYSFLFHLYFERNPMKTLYQKQSIVTHPQRQKHYSYWFHDK